MKNLHTVLPPFGFSHYYYKLKAVKTLNLLQNDKEISKLYLHAKNYTQNGLINKIIQHLVDLIIISRKKKWRIREQFTRLVLDQLVNGHKILICAGILALIHTILVSK